MQQHFTLQGHEKIRPSKVNYTTSSLNELGGLTSSDAHASNTFNQNLLPSLSIRQILLLLRSNAWILPTT